MADDNGATADASTAEGTEGAHRSGDTQDDTQVDRKADPAEKWKALARKHEERAKENAEKAKAYDEFVESQKTEQQKLAEAKAAAEKQAADTAAELAVMRAAVKYGLTEDDLELLEGVPADQVDARAKKIADRLGGQRKTAFPDLGQGERGRASEQRNDMNALIRNASGRAR